MNAAIDRAAEAAGRRPADVRRLFNINGSFGSDTGFLQGAPRDWAEQLSELTLNTGMSAYILSVSSDDDVRRFAEEVAPAVRELVIAGRAAADREPAAAPVTTATSASRIPDAAPLAATPTPDDGRRLSDEQPWDETTRPTGAAPDPSRRYSPDQQAAGRHLIDVHDGLRRELTELRDLIAQVAQGEREAAAARSFIARMTIRQNHWTLGTFCESYCRVVTQHHTLEDRGVFPHIQRSEPALAPVIERLEEEHETIADLLERVDQALVGLVSSQDDGIAGVDRAVAILNDALLSHFSYEERELIEPLARLGFYLSAAATVEARRARLGVAGCDRAGDPARVLERDVRAGEEHAAVRCGESLDDPAGGPAHRRVGPPAARPRVAVPVVRVRLEHARLRCVGPQRGLDGGSVRRVQCPVDGEPDHQLRLAVRGLDRGLLRGEPVQRRAPARGQHPVGHAGGEHPELRHPAGVAAGERMFQVGLERRIEGDPGERVDRHREHADRARATTRRPRCAPPLRPLPG